MALIRYAEGQQRSGSIGGTVYSHNSAGQYIRARSIPVNPSSGRQQTIRDALAALVHMWTNTLTSSQRAAWLTYGKNVPVPNRLGDTIKIGGNNWFFAFNTPRIQAGLAPIADGPTTYAGADSPTGIAITGDVIGQTIEVTFNAGDPWATAVGGALLVYQGLPINASRNFYKGPYRYAGKVAGALVPPTSPAELPASYAVVADAVTNLYVRALLPDGRTSSRFGCSFLGGA